MARYAMRYARSCTAPLSAVFWLLTNATAPPYHSSACNLSSLTHSAIYLLILLSPVARLLDGGSTTRSCCLSRSRLVDTRFESPKHHHRSYDITLPSPNFTFIHRFALVSRFRSFPFAKPCPPTNFRTTTVCNEAVTASRGCFGCVVSLGCLARCS